MDQLSILEERYYRALKTFGKPPDIIIISKEHADMLIEEFRKIGVYSEKPNRKQHSNECYFMGVRVEII